MHGLGGEILFDIEKKKAKVVHELKYSLDRCFNGIPKNELLKPAIGAIKLYGINEGLIEND